MSLKSAFTAMKKEGYVTRPLDKYLLSLNAKDSDRVIDINAPSSSGGCLRARYYSRVGVQADSNTIDPRTRRIFDNGTHFHIRTQEYLLKAGVLLMDEVPVFNKFYKIQGHTDGLLHISEEEIAVLELKSINAKGFSELKDAKPEHKLQGLIYLHCLEEHRKYLKASYRTSAQFNKSRMSRKMLYASFYTHLKDGSKYTRKEKVAFQLRLHMTLDNILYNLDTAITKVVFVYENKDTQDIKEFVTTSDDRTSKDILSAELNDCTTLNSLVSMKQAPPRGGKNKSDNYCRWCNYKDECWVL